MIRKKQYVLTACIGTLLIFYGLILPSFLNDWSELITTNIQTSIIDHDSGLLLITSFIYIAKYMLTFYLIYFGSMLILQPFRKKLTTLSWSFAYIGTVLLSLTIFNQIYLEHFSYLGYFLTIGIIIFLLQYIPKHKHFYFIFSIILFLVLLAVQWMQLIPALTGFGAGSNDLAASIKIADSYLTGNNLFNTLATVFFSVFLTIAISVTLLSHLFNKQIDTLRKFQVQGEVLQKTRSALVDSKVHEEVNMLVHDLKTPLVTVEGLISLIQMKMQAKNDHSLKNYVNRIDRSISKMKDMISEILHDQMKQKLSVKELLEYVTSHLNMNEQQVELIIDLDESLPYIVVNKIRFSRAISNILENAIHSFDGKAGYIHITVKSIDTRILIRIQDNGPGIDSAHLKEIWKEGFSTRNSSGLGLSFVKRVIENHHGTIDIKSIPGNHTQLNIKLPISKAGENTDEYYHINS
ncbi:HAMP domain-containing sensor histidine kinase [Virgibacillus ihumii]|uniref:HAMP domain-containing sensor histidine kinase n=1 Tax=Virgibacillus ihumii TaxID=2686091 RepID=UPI00157CA220|nr:HAMP domain-containing sensor histidine kinase [Virgibacillus ihumii]